MRLCIDATSLLLRSAGVKNYTYHWLRALRAQAGEEAVRAFPAIGGFGNLDHEASLYSRLATIPRIALLFAVNKLPELHLLDAYLGDADLFHASNQVRQPPRRARLTATIHDLTCWLMPEFHTPGNIRADREFAERILKRADGLIAVSENSRKDAIEILGLAPEKVHTIHSGVAESFLTVTAEQGAATAARYQLYKPYALYVGTIEPRKNIDGLLDAYESLPADLQEEFDLVIAGPVGWGSEKTAARLHAPATSGIRYLGYLPEDDLPALTKAASLFVYPSFYEGFGFPVAQAMACGVAVLTSDNSCLPEITGGAALLVDPRSVGELQAGLVKLITSPSLRAQLGERGSQNAKQYNWERCAAESLAVFRQILERVR